MSVVEQMETLGVALFDWLHAVFILYLYIMDKSLFASKEQKEDVSQLCVSSSCTVSLSNQGQPSVFIKFWGGWAKESECKREREIPQTVGNLGRSVHTLMLC